MAEAVDSVVAESIALYAQFIDDRTLDEIGKMSRPDQVYFWSYLYHHMGHELERSWLEKLEKRAKKRAGKPRMDSATPFKDAERSTSAHSFFGVRL